MSIIMSKKMLFEWSSKRFYSFDEESYLMSFKDEIHGWWMESSIHGTGTLRKEFSYYFYKLLEKNGINTHLCHTHSLQENGIIVRKVQPIKIEILVRNVARWHWVDSHKVPIIEWGAIFENPVVEYCLKIKTQLDDGRILDDPRVNEDMIIELDILCKIDSVAGTLIHNKEEFARIREIALRVNAIYKKFLSEHNLILEDFKFEIGVDLSDTKEIRDFILIDEISPDCSRIRDEKWNSISKDLFRQKKPKELIYKWYKELADSIKDIS